MSVLSTILWCTPPKKNPGSAPASLCLSTESISKAIMVARRGLFGSKKKEKNDADLDICTILSHIRLIAALLYLFPTTFVIEGRHS